MSFRDVYRLRTTAQLAREFAKMCDDIADKQAAHDIAYAEWDSDQKGTFSYFQGPQSPSPKDTAEARRRSMDLSRALSTLRKTI